MSDERLQPTRDAPLPLDGADVTMLRLALNGLPTEQRQAIQLSVTERLTLPDIAIRLGSSQADVCRAMRDGLLALRDVLSVVGPAVAAEHDNVNA